MPTTIDALDANGVPQTIPTLPALGQTTATGSLPAVLANDSALPLPAPIYPISSTSAESGRILSSVGASIASLSVVIGASSGYVMLFDAISIPADGAVTPKWCQYVVSDGTSGNLVQQWAPGPPLQFANGIVVVFSTSGPFTKMASATAAFSAQVQTYLPALPNLTLEQIAALVNTLFSSYSAEPDTTGAVTVTPTTPFSVFKFTNTLTGNLVITIETTGMVAGYRCRIISPASLGGFSFTASSIALTENQFVEFIFDGTTWRQIDTGYVISAVGTADFTSPHNSSLLGAVVA
jgi:hypothetical protein